MTYVVAVNGGVLGKSWGYVCKRDGMNGLVSDPELASKYPTAEDARASGRVGHHRDMGGTGLKGTIIPTRTARENYRARRNRR